MSEPKVIRVEIQNNKDGERTQARAHIIPEPGVSTIWDFRLPFASDDIALRIEWPEIQIKEDL